LELDEANAEHEDRHTDTTHKSVPHHPKRPGTVITRHNLVRANCTVANLTAARARQRDLPQADRLTCG